MHVKKVVLEGFKSYRDRTDIGPFDPHFNAITGLNGSGKSNILDAICFVLGISSMSVVRCKNLADCIYMGHGESLNRAMVSIILDNTDKSKSPPGQQNYDEIIVSRTVQKGGDCRYHINRIGASKRAVTDLFESVQLNVNNPNFMIMQGKITKVVNMKPKELLHMIEETVGATLYQAKREKAEVELRNKQQTIESINGLIFEHIKPSLDKQTKAAETIQEYQIQMREKTDRAIEWAVAQYFELQARGTKAKQELNKILQQDEKDDELVEGYKQEIKELKKREEQMKKENTSKFQEKVDETEKALKEQRKHLQAKETDVKTAKEALEKAKKQVKEAEKSKVKEEKLMNEFKNESSKSVAEFEALKARKKSAEAELEKSKEQENQLRSGKLLDEEGKSMDVNHELNRVSTEIAAIKPDVEDGRQRIQEGKRKLVSLEQQLKTTPSDDQVEKDYKQKEQIVERLRREAEQRSINADLNVVELRHRLQERRKQRDVAARERELINRRFHNLQFNYNKDRVSPQGIRGCVYDHLKLNGVEEWGNALEVAVGGFMGHIVVDNDTVGKNLLKNGSLTRRTYVHPLNTFRGHRAPAKLTQRYLDENLGPGNAVSALSLVECEGWLQPLVEHYIGGKVLCKNMDIARKCAFTLNCQSYTVAGDYVDPGGIMQGGSRSNLGETVKACMGYYNTCRILEQLGQEIETLEEQLQLAQANSEFVERFENAKRELLNADKVRKMTKYSQLKDEIANIKQMLQDDTAKLKEVEGRYTTLEKSRAQLQKKADEMENHREKQMREIASRIKKSEKDLESITKTFETRKKFFDDLEVNLNSKEAFLQDCQRDIDEAIAKVTECEQKLETARKEVDAFMEKFQKYQKAYDDAVAESNEWHEEAKQIQEKIKVLDKKKETCELNKMKRNNQRTNYQEYVNGAGHELEDLQERFPSIDFSKQQPPRGKGAAALKSELDKISKKLEDMQQRLDHEAAQALPNTKREFATSTDKLTMIEKNKKGLVKAIETLDLSKKQKVRAAYDDVNNKFNDMMQTLLPEARARLVEVEPGDLSQGVNIHVQLGGVWKESLTELSGGQRSLVALSLVLSLCMYNPAPFYILDEVDAALDLSHTQNIGVVIQRQFKGTQFICVSLKDGMFSNANVLFTAKHEGGKSVVTRSAKVNRAMPPPNNDDRNNRYNKNKK